MLKVSVISPVKNEVDFIGYSVMAVLPYVHEIIYAVAPSSNDGTIELLRHIAKSHGQIGGKLRIITQSKYDFDPLDMKAYNEAYNDCIDNSSGDACWFLHPDMIVTNPEKISELTDGPLAWTVNMTSYAHDLTCQITKGRAGQWKNIHAKKFGLHYFGGYGSANEDFYHRDITGSAYRHYGSEFSKYPFEVAQSGINVNHYCELKGYKRRFEKMKLCLKTQNPKYSDHYIEELAMNHPRVTLEPGDTRFGQFEFKPTEVPIPDVFAKYKTEFDVFKKESLMAFVLSTGTVCK